MQQVHGTECRCAVDARHCSPTAWITTLGGSVFLTLRWKAEGGEDLEARTR